MLSDTDKSVYGLDRKTGSLVRKTQLPGYVDSSPAIAGDKVRFQMSLCCEVGWLVGWVFLTATPQCVPVGCGSSEAKLRHEFPSHTPLAHMVFVRFALSVLMC